jgi:hypothetical protein
MVNRKYKIMSEAENKEKLTGNEKVYLKFVGGNAGSYENKKEGTSYELGLVGFPISWLNGSTDEMRDFSEIIDVFCNNSCDEFIREYGSYDEFWSTCELTAKIVFEDESVAESKKLDPFA